ncbi:helix-turn-helix domain-containing protein [[Clostridium] fimetarium]|uniref:Helix-turn-helix n=1 Tax=[Clostridium] fimetarium TaxID=99656 RepID=A0A1I0M0F8_9FIRM|nr:helix-turn-helix transcriptional regulator [[Clostridium] fimetarium]SEV81557.1 Helix-turn-helix [[Clostridium] fimetarium]
MATEKRRNFNDKEIKVIHSHFRKLREDTETNDSGCISQRTLAAEIGLMYSRISNLESEEGIDEPSVKDLMAYHKKFNVPYEYLLGESNNIEYQNMKISKELGLSDGAINNITKLNEAMAPHASDYINKILESETLSWLIDDILKYIDATLKSEGSFKNSNTCSDKDALKYTQEINHIIKENGLPSALLSNYSASTHYLRMAEYTMGVIIDDIYRDTRKNLVSEGKYVLDPNRRKKE